MTADMTGNIEKRAKLPPVPKDSKIKQALGLGIGIWDYMEEKQRTLGDTFTLTLPGQGPMVWTCNQAMIKDILRLKESQYDQSLVQIPVDVGENNTVFLNEKEHQDSRKLIIPSFNAKRLKDRAGVMHEIISSYIDNFKPGQEFNIPRLIGDMTLDVICFTMLDLREGARKERYKELMLNWLLESTSDTMFTIGSLVGARRYRQFLHNQYRKRTETGNFGNGKKGVLPWKRSVDLKAQLAAMLREDIRAIRERNNEDEVHVLSVLARTKDADGKLLDEERIIAESVGLLIAGHETSAATSAWFFIWLQKNPQVRQKICDEVEQSIEDEGGFNAAKVSELPYLTACLNESQRLSPSAVGCIRWLRDDTPLGDRIIPGGTAVLPNIYLTHRDKAIYGDDALEYRPERWSENKYGPSEFLPFGGGARACVGMNQGRQQLKLIFAEFCRRVVWSSAYDGDGKLPRSRMIGGQTEPENGVPARVVSVQTVSQ
ncbi:MAG: cytochrome P450 [Pseudomonadales bacterium]|nr:cytochrome P450 [Pseudomonadales bacterium]